VDALPVVPTRGIPAVFPSSQEGKAHQHAGETICIKKTLAISPVIQGSIQW